jgi:RNA polymerase sigma-70 factor (ECF subfamily)
LSECISDGVNIEDIFSRDEIRILFQQFIAELGDTDRRIFLRRYYYAEEISTIANRYGMTPVTVRVRLFRLRKQFKDVLEKGGHSV